MISNVSVISSKITFDCDFFSLWNSHSVLHDYFSIEAALVQYQILLKEVMLKQKVVCYS